MQATERFYQAVSYIVCVAYFVSVKLAMAHRWRLHRAAETPRGIATMAALLFIYAFPAFLLNSLSRNASSTGALYAPDGVIVAGLLVLSRPVGFIFCVACFIVNITQSILNHEDIAHNLLYSCLNQGVSLATAVMIRTFCGAATDLFRFRRLLAFATIAAVAASVEALVGQIVVVLVEHSGVQAFGHWLQWAGEDALGLLIVTPAILLPLKRRRSVYASDAGVVECWLLLTVVAGLSALAFGQAHGLAMLLIYPLLVLVAFRGGPVWVSTAVLITTFEAAAMTVHGMGPLAMMARGDDLRTELLLQLFIVSIFMSTIPATTALDERNRANHRLRRIHAVAREARAAAEAANAAKSQFLANVSHEIRTPLNGVLGMAQAMAADHLPPVQRERLDLIQTSGEALLAILNDVLDLSKIEAGKMELESVPFDIGEIARSAHATFETLARKKGVAYVLTVAPTAAGSYLGDPVRLRQILCNLLSNALKFTEAGYVSMEVLAAYPGLSIRVADTGIGISEDAARRLFKKFEQADVSTTRRFGGTGLGLAICRELIEQMGGTVTLDSEVGVGSTFSLTLPWARAPAAVEPPEAAAPTAAVERPEAAALTPSPAADSETDARILAVDDNPMNLLVLKTLLGQIGLTPTTAVNGMDAFAAWEGAEWDVILMDVQMPVLDGMAATRRIREREAATGRRRTPIIALTADVMSHQVAAGRAAGMDSFVGKPVNARELYEAIGAAMDGNDPAPQPVLACSA